jgi:hypothetical protein
MLWPGFRAVQIADRVLGLSISHGKLAPNPHLKRLRCLDNGPLRGQGLGLGGAYRIFSAVKLPHLEILRDRQGLRLTQCQLDRKCSGGYYRADRAQISGTGLSRQRKRISSLWPRSQRLGYHQRRSILFFNSSSCYQTP